MKDFRATEARPGAAPEAERCVRCGLAFRCGARAGDASCWCADLPPLAAVPGQTCLCPACLKDLASGRS